MRAPSLSLLLLALSTSLSLGASNDFFGEMLGGNERKRSRARYEFRHYGNERAGGEKFALQQNRFDASMPIGGDESSSWRGSIAADYDGIESKARFSNSRPVPNRLWDVGAGISNSRTLDNGRTIGGGLSLGSASDRPFSAGRDLGFSLNLSLKVPGDGEAAWFYFLNVSNSRGFLNYFPLPGFAYFFKAHPKLRMLVGLPFAMIIWTPVDLWTLTAFYVPIRNAELRMTFGKARGLQPYTLVNLKTRNVRLHDRLNGEERLFIEEGLAQAGLNVPLAPGFLLDFSGGLSFSRRLYLAENSGARSDASTPTLQPANAPFASAKLAATF